MPLQHVCAGCIERAAGLAGPPQGFEGARPAAAGRHDASPAQRPAAAQGPVTDSRRAARPPASMPTARPASSPQALRISPGWCVRRFGARPASSPQALPAPPAMAACRRAARRHPERGIRRDQTRCPPPPPPARPGDRPGARDPTRVMQAEPRASPRRPAALRGPRARPRHVQHEARPAAPHRAAPQRTHRLPCRRGPLAPNHSWPDRSRATGPPPARPQAAWAGIVFMYAGVTAAHGQVQRSW